MPSIAGPAFNLVEDGFIGPDHPIAPILTDLQMTLGRENIAAPLSVHNLLCHRHGTDSDVSVGLDTSNGDITVARVSH